eukprot:1603846-Prymnesium_polylepis.1
MQVVRLVSCFSTCNAVRRVTLITAPGALRNDVRFVSSVPHTPEQPCERCAAEPELVSFNTSALVLRPPPQSAGAGRKPL